MILNRLAAVQKEREGVRVDPFDAQENSVSFYKL